MLYKRSRGRCGSSHFFIEYERGSNRGFDIADGKCGHRLARDKVQACPAGITNEDDCVRVVSSCTMVSACRISERRLDWIYRAEFWATYEQLIGRFLQAPTRLQKATNQLFVRYGDRGSVKDRFKTQSTVRPLWRSWLKGRFKTQSTVRPLGKCTWRSWRSER
jgi:hypothetical protein